MSDRHYFMLHSHFPGSGIFVCLLGVAYFANIHKLYYFIIVQIFGGALQVSPRVNMWESHNKTQSQLFV